MIWKFRRRRVAPRRSWYTRLGRLLRFALYASAILVVLDVFYLSLLWPDWGRLAGGAVPESKFIGEYRTARRTNARLAPLRWQPVPLAMIPEPVRQAVILAEDSRFFQHEGFDLIAFKEAMEYNLAKRRFALGASTISQQTTKNLFLSRSRDPLRKWHELVLTFALERHLDKERILEIYLNVAEFGEGVFGVEAAARRYWNRSIATLGWPEAAELAATLPSPRKDNPATATARFRARTQKILGFIERFEIGDVRATSG